MVEEIRVTGSVRAKLVRRFASIAIGSALAACSVGYAVTWVWSSSLVRDLTALLPAGFEGEDPQAKASALLGRQLDEFLHERIADVRGWASGPTVIHAAREAHLAHEELGLLSLTVEELENKFKVSKGIGRFPVADGYLHAEIVRSKYFYRILFTDRNGYNVAVTGASPDFVQSDEDWWQRAWSDGAVIGSEATYDRETDRWGIDISMRIDDPTTGKPVGVLQASLSIAVVKDIIDRYRERGYGEQITVADHRGLLLADTSSQHSHTRVMNEKFNLRDRVVDARQAAFGADHSGRVIEGGQIMEYSRTSSGEFYADLARGSRFPGFNWVVMVQTEGIGAASGINAALEKVGAWRRTYADILGGSFLVIALLAGGIVWWMAGRISHPIRYLRATALRISQGRVTDAVQLDTNDEFAEIARALERIQRIMRQAVRALRERRKGSTT